MRASISQRRLLKIPQSEEALPHPEPASVHGFNHGKHESGSLGSAPWNASPSLRTLETCRGGRKTRRAGKMGQGARAHQHAVTFLDFAVRPDIGRCVIGSEEPRPGGVRPARRAGRQRGGQQSGAPWPCDPATVSAVGSLRHGSDGPLPRPCRSSRPGGKMFNGRGGA